MNESQKLLTELSESEEKAVRFLKNVTYLIELERRAKSRMVISFLVGIIFGMFIFNLVIK